MAESVVSFVAERLGNLFIEEAKFLRGVTRQVELMQMELELIQSYLEDADKRQDEDNRVHTWVSKIREAAYDAEDIIDTFALKIASRRRGVQSVFKRYACIICEAAELHEVGSEIEAVLGKISTLTRCLETYGIKHTREAEGPSSAHGRPQQWSQSYSHVVEEFTVGLEADVMKLVALLSNEETHCEVVSICGMGGIGKTTLAKNVYHHGKIKLRFECFAWAYVSQQCQKRKVWEGILFDLISPSNDQREEIEKLRDEELAQKLQNVLKEKKCLVILDDIWNIETWDSLSLAFLFEEVGSSKILLTTRTKDIAFHADPTTLPHELQCLTVEQSLELLEKKAFQGNDDPEFKHAVMDRFGREMVEGCAGLPLAIVVLGGLLATKHTLNEWNIVHKNMCSYLRRAKGHGQHHPGVFKVLGLSYQELPYHLKSCFLHLANFPENFDIPTKKLFKMWVAEGIISPVQYDVEREETLEDIANSYLHELINRCMVQVGARGSTGKVKTCRLHNLMRNLCVLKADQENFLKIVPVPDGNEPMVTIAHSGCQVHRLAIHLGAQSNFSWKYERNSCVRSLLLFSNYFTTISPKMESKFSDFKLLRVLDLESFRISDKLPRAIAKLICLRYLSLNCSNIRNLSSSIGKLKWLQTLILFLNLGSEAMRLPDVIWKMERLRYLCLPRDYKAKSGGKLRLTDSRDLQTLQNLDASIFDVKQLIQLTNLQKLGIRKLKSFTGLEGFPTTPSHTFNRLRSLRIGVDSVIEESDLQKLFSACHILHKLFLEGRIRKLPEYSHFPENLSKLTLWWSVLEEDPMPTLEKLPNLIILRLHEDSFIRNEMFCSSKGFPQLRSLLLEGLTDLEEWLVEEEAMPRLCELVIGNCRKLKMVPDGLRFITTLRKLEFRGMPVEFENRLRVVNVGGEDLYKVQHVPSIIFEGLFD